MDAQSHIEWVERQQERAHRHGVCLILTAKSVAGYAELNLIQVPEGKRRSGWGTAVMRDLVDSADAAGLVLAVTPSSDFGGSKAGVERFLRRFGFVTNRGRDQDFTVSQTMIRRPRG